MIKFDSEKNWFALVYARDENYLNQIHKNRNLKIIFVKT